MDGLEATRRIADCAPKVRILVLTSFGSDDLVFPAVKAGAAGYILKDSGPQELVQAIQQVHQGESSLHPAIARKLLQELACPSARQTEAETLTDRELEVLRLVASGLTNREIAGELGISEATVRTHVSHFLRKLGLDTRTQAALYALREGLASLHDTNSLLDT
jgi:NarL family two-component system response regulator LiaR